MSDPDDGSDVVALAKAHGLTGFVDPDAEKAKATTPDAMAPDKTGAAKIGADDGSDVLALIARMGLPGWGR